MKPQRAVRLGASSKNIFRVRFEQRKPALEPTAELEDLHRHQQKPKDGILTPASIHQWS